MKIRTKFWIGPAVNDPAAEAPGELTPSPEDLAAPNSRRVAANAVHINGAAAGASPLPPEPSQSSNLPARRDPWMVAAGAVIAGAAAAAGAAIDAVCAVEAGPLLVVAAAGRAALGAAAAAAKAVGAVPVVIPGSPIASWLGVAAGAATCSGTATGELRGPVRCGLVAGAVWSDPPRAALRGEVLKPVLFDAVSPPVRRVPEGEADR